MQSLSSRNRFPADPNRHGLADPDRRSGNAYQGTVSCRNLYMLRVPNPTTIYVELANIKNEADRKRILPATNRQALANWLYEGLVKK